MEELSPAQVALLREFESGLDLRHPERSAVPARILGYGEISTVFEIQDARLAGLAFKRLPLFRDLAEVERYRSALEGYVDLLTRQVGLHLARHRWAALARPNGRPVFYIVQDQVPAEWVGHRAIHRLSEGQVCSLVLAVMRELRKVWAYNRSQGAVEVAIDGQLSNWAMGSLSPDRPGTDGLRLAYLDTSTPLFRVQGVEQLDTELFLRSAPSFLAWILRALFLRDVVDRYYDFHQVAVDLAANLYKEQLPEAIPAVVDTINRFFGEEAGLDVAAVSLQEVRSYYREDALIWRLYLSMRKVDRALRTRLLRREYPYLLPDKVRR